MKKSRVWSFIFEWSSVFARKLLKVTLIMAVGAMLWPWIVDMQEVMNDKYRLNRGWYSDSLGCVLTDAPRERRPYRLNLSAEECELVEYVDGNVVTVNVSYPSMEVIRGRARDTKKVTFYLIYVDAKSFDQNRIFNGRQPIDISNGIETFEDGSGIVRRFSGSDGRVAVVVEQKNYRVGRRSVNDRIEARFRYVDKKVDVRQMDDFALTFLNRIASE